VEQDRRPTPSAEYAGAAEQQAADGPWLADCLRGHGYRRLLSVREFRRVFDHATEQMHFRSRSDVERFFTGLELVSPYQPESGRATVLCG
jgi:hypothetical protein